MTIYTHSHSTYVSVYTYIVVLDGWFGGDFAAPVVSQPTRGQHFNEDTLSTLKVSKSQILGCLNSQKQAPNRQFKATKQEWKRTPL